MAATSVCIVGGGICGLSTALSLIEANSGYDITIVADKFSPDTTSNAAAAIVVPYLLGAETPVELQKRWIKQTMDWVGMLYKTEDADVMGISVLDVYFYFDHEEEDPEWKDWLLGYRRITPEEMERAICHENIADGWCSTTFCLDTNLFMAWLTKKLKSHNCRFIKKKLTDLSEVSMFDIVVNCSGIGANQLVPDPSVVPVRGQIMRVKAPWVQHGCLFGTANALYYIIPRPNCVVLGGTTQVGNWNKTIDKEDSKRIFEDCCKIIPSLKHAEIIKEVVDLRPRRPSVRLEIEKRRVGRKEIKIVHNYGHGGSGISLQWGCALDSRKLIDELAKEIRVSSRL